MVTFDPQQGFLVDGKPANLWGRTGRNVLDANTAAAGALSSNAYDPRYYEAYSYNNGDAGDQTAYRLRPEYQERLGNRTQLASQGVGGYGEVIDPSQVDYDEEFGLLTDRRNIKEPGGARWHEFIPYLVGAGMLGAIGAAGGFSGLLGGAGTGAGTGAGLEVSSEMQALLEQGTAAHQAAADAAAASGVNQGLQTLQGLAPGTLTQAAASTPWYQQLLQNAQSNLTNPMMVARGLLGAGSLLNSLKPSGGGSDASGGGDLTPANVPRFNPAGLLANYRAPTFDPVPFMSGKYGLLGS